MRIQPISNNQQSFKAVNQKYFAWAKEDFRLTKNVSTEWLDRLEFDVFLFKKINAMDAIDTINAVKKYMDKSSNGTEYLLKLLRQLQSNQ